VTESKVVEGSGVSLGGVVFIVLLILKLTGNIAMSWFGVITSIIWAPLLVMLIFLGFIGVIFVFVGMLSLISTISAKFKR